MQPSVMLVVLLMLTMPLINGVILKAASRRKAFVPYDRSNLDSHIGKRRCPAGCKSCPDPFTCVPAG
nr:conotoxin precursor Cerm03 [Conus ebraeus]UMA83256.1 conotoxin precursor Cerm03 [Conus judaeus]